MSLPTSRNIVLGSGRVYFDDGTGELYLAETPGFSLQITEEAFEVLSDDGPVAEPLLNKTTKVSRNFTLSTKNIIDAALAMFVIGDVAAKTTTSAPVTAKPINGGVGVKQGKWYQLGVDANNPAGIRKVTAVAIKAGATTHVLNTDYVLDTDLARIYIVPGGGIADNTVITSDYSTSAVSWSEITSNDLGAKTGALRYIADNTAGENRDLFIPSCVMGPNGEAAFKSRKEVQTLGFVVKVQKPDDGRASLYINGRAA